MEVSQGQSSRLTVDLDALRANFATLTAHAAPARCGAVVKADAYGLGARPVATALHREGCRDFFVAQIGEARDLSAALPPDSRIYVLNGLAPGDTSLDREGNIVPVVNSGGQLDLLRRHARAANGPLRVALQADTGMSRLGLDLEALRALATDPTLTGELSVGLVMTHLACADLSDHPANGDQLARFREVRALFPSVPASVGNSAAIFLGRNYHLDLVRAGLALFGVSPSPGATRLKPVVRLEGRVLQTHTVPAGGGVGYGLDYVAPSPRRLATLGIGYADGLPRSLGGRGAAWVGDVRVPFAGRVSMDSLTVDVTDLPGGGPEFGELVELIGPHASVEQVAETAGTIGHELLTRLTAGRFSRIYVEEGRATVLPAGVRP